MADNVEVIINEKEKFTGRLIGLIGPMDCRALINTEDVAKKVFTAESVVLSDALRDGATEKRFVLATTNYSDDGRREIFISPIIRFLSYKFNKKILRCEDENEYALSEL